MAATKTKGTRAAAKARGGSARGGNGNGRNGGNSKAKPRSKAQAASNGGNGKVDHRSTRPGAGGLDAMLTDATEGGIRRWLPGRSAAKAAVKLATRPDKVARHAAGLYAELAKIAIGRSDVEPAKGDRRFKDTAWTTNPAFKRLGQAYLATGRTVDSLVCAADLDWEAERRMRFAVENVLDALAPTNLPGTNPAVVKATIDSGGLNFVKGATHFARDMRRPPRIPSMVDQSAFEVGDDLAVTPGAVVLRTPVFELIQYEPQTSKVRTRPVLFTPPMINKYYVTDLAPDRSMIEHVVKAGQQAFTISWKNPGEEAADWSLDTYAQAVVEAIDAVETITGTDKTHLMGLCAGGIVLSTVAAHLSATGQGDRIAGLSLGVCVLDNEHAGTAGAFMDPATAAMAVADSARRGYLSGRALAGVFAWLRPNDLIWNYWVNNYLMGKEPPAFDILYWNADTTNMPAALHRDFVELSLANSLVHPGELEVLGTPIDLRKIEVDSYLVAGIADHITPWQNAYRTTQLLGSEPRFVLSTSGHIAAMVNPPGNEKSSYRTNDANPEDADTWLKTAAQQPGTWWDDWVEWLSTRSGDEKRAPQKLGKSGFEPLDPAPGTYVR
ncbi:MAG: poly[(R)-3-hydroxyalkanoate] polymerase subunit PhaC [Thermoleophilaceae bacterium]|nr:poly[(R)-3-hydroxyalkanoate] polymerase subunit PhaC [Thermoleophilaceae bacterium]